MSNNSDNNQSLSLELFLTIPVDFIRINSDEYIQNIIGSNLYSVELLINYPDISISNSYKSHRNFAEFKELFEKITKDNPKVPFQEFPSRYSFWKFSEEAIVKFFNTFLNKILELCKEINHQQENLTLLYNFIFKTKETTVTKLTKIKLKKFFNIDSDEDSDLNSEEKEQKEKPEKNGVKSISPNKKPIQIHKRVKTTLSTKNLTIFNNPSDIEEDKLSVNSETNANNDDNRSTDNNLNFDAIKRNTINFFNKKINSVLNNKESDLKNFISGIKRTISIDDKENTPKEDNKWENVYVKTSLKDYSLHTVKIKERCLLLINNEKKELDEKEIEEKIIIENNKECEEDYYLIIPLYKINIEIFRKIYQPEDRSKGINKDNLRFVKKKYIPSSEIYDFEKYAPNSILFDVNSEIVIRLYHDYDRFETFIKFDCDKRISSVKNFLSRVENNSFLAQVKSLYINEVTESYMDSFGSILINMMNFKAPNYEGKIQIKVNLDPYLIPTKAIMSKGNFDFNQQFLLPIHNRFKYLKFLVYKKKESRYFYKKDADKLIATCEIPLPNLINIYFINKNSIVMKLMPVKEKNKKKLKYADMSLEFKIFDYSSLLSLLVKNTNKRVLDDYPLYTKEGDSEEPYTISILLKRIKRVLAMFKNIYSFYKMLQYFKYPVLSVTFLLIIIFYTFFCEPGYILTHILIFIISILIFYSSVFNKYVYPKISHIFLSYPNKYNNPSQIAKTESQINKEEVAKSDYLIKKKGFSLSFKELKEVKHAYIDLLFRLSRIASFFEKFKNLFLWTDPLLSLYMIALLILVLLVVWNIQLRYIACFSIVKKFIFGIFFYKNRLINNKEIARIVVEDAFNIWQAEKAKEKSKERAKEKTKEKEKEEKKSETEVIKTMEKRPLDDEKLKNILKTKLYEHSNIILRDDFYNSMETIGDVIEELGKVDDILKIKRLSYLFHKTKNNSKIYRKDIDPEDVFAYFIQNIKSDYYRESKGFIESDFFKNENIINKEDIKENSDNKNKSHKTLSNDIENVDIKKIILDK